MVRVFKKSGSRNYYFQVMVDGERFVESTRTSVFRDASRIAARRCAEIRLKLDYHFYLKILMKTINKLEPEERERALKKCMDEITLSISRRVKLEDAFELFRTKPRKRKVSERTYVLYRNLWCKFVTFVNDNFPDVKYMNEITCHIAEKFLWNEMQQGITERTYNERITKFRSIFSALAEEAGLVKQVWKSIDKMREGHISKRPLTKEQLKQLFETAQGEMRTLFMIGLFTGLRLGDAATLKWSEVDFERSVISRLPNKTRNLQKNVEIPLLGELKKELEAVKEGQSGQKNIYVLPDLAQKYTASDSYVSNLVQAVFRKAGIKTMVEREGVKRKAAVYGFHSFRHSFVSLCAAGRIPMNVVMELVGHRSEMVHKIYQHASEEQKVEAINLIEKEFEEKDGE